MSAFSRRSCGHAFVLAATCTVCARYAADCRAMRGIVDDWETMDAAARWIAEGERERGVDARVLDSLSLIAQSATPDDPDFAGR